MITVNESKQVNCKVVNESDIWIAIRMLQEYDQLVNWQTYAASNIDYTDNKLITKFCRLKATCL